MYYEPMKPLRDIVLIQADKPKEKTASGLYIKEEWKTLPPTGTVVAIGHDVGQVSVGDRVVFERYGAIILENDQRLCKESHILAKIDAEKA